MICKRCLAEWDFATGGISCPQCRAAVRPTAEELAAAYSLAVALEQDKKEGEAFRLYALLSSAGSLDGEEAYARCFRDGVGTPRDLARAADGYLDAAEHGSARAAYRLGRLLSSHPRLVDGRGTPFFWLSAAAALGSADAAAALAFSGKRYSLDEGTRLRYLDAAARGGNRRALSSMARRSLFARRGGRDVAAARWYLDRLERGGALLSFCVLLLGNPPPCEPTPLVPHTGEDLLALGAGALDFGFPTTALRLFLLAAGCGSALGALRAGDAYCEGVGTLPDRDTALSFYLRAEQEGLAEAALKLGRLYERELSDRTEAERHYLRAAESGVGEYQYILGEFYLAGDRGGEGVRLAVPWLRRAAKGGCAAAAERLLGIDARLSETYNRALEAQRMGNVREAFALYENAAALGHAAALSNYGYCLQKGIGTLIDHRAAARAYREAVAAGSEAGRLNLAACYMGGIGIRRDFAAARALLVGVGGEYAARAEELLATLDEGRRRHRAAALYSASCAVFHRGDVVGALRLRLAAARLGSPAASYMIGCHFEFGDGVEEDRARAATFYTAAAEGGITGSRLKSGYLRARRAL